MAASERTLAAGTMALAGRTLIVLGGAYLIRALTDTAVLPAMAGVAAGLAYAAWWLFRLDRAASAGERRSAVFHGLAAMLIAYPLLWETTARFGVLTPAAAALALWAFALAGLALASRHDLAEVAWLGVLFAVATAASLLVVTRDLLPFTLALLGLSLVVESFAFENRWPGLRWPAAFGADLAVFVAVFVTARPEGVPEGYAPFASGAVVAVGLALTALYLGSIWGRTLLRDRPVTPFEVLQAAAALLVGFGGAASVNASMGGRPTGVGLYGLALGIAGYAVAFAFVERRPGRARNFYFHATLAGLLTLVGTWMVLRPASRALLWSAAAVAGSALGSRFDRSSLRVHAAVYLTAAAGAAGLLGCATDALVAAARGSWRPLTLAGLLVTLAAAACYWQLAATRRTSAAAWWLLLPRACVAAAAAWVAAGLTVRGLASALAAPAPGADAAVVATLRTAVLAALAVALAWAARRWMLRDLAWLVYAVLAAGAFKLLAEDLRHGRPVTLFLALSAYGAALMATTRLTSLEDRNREAS